MVQAKKWILAHHFEWMPKDSDIELVEETLPALEDGDVLLEALYLSVDPFWREYSIQQLKEGDTILGEQVALVKESSNSKFPRGSYVVAKVGWRSHTVTSDVSLLRPVTPIGSLPLSYHLNILGMPGMKAYFGLFEICHPKKGDVVLVNGAGCTVGWAVGQLAKIRGCKVVAIAGTEEKCRWLRDELKLDVVYNYKTVTDEEKAIREAVPEGIDVFFDNIGGIHNVAVTRCMNEFGRISLCSVIAEENAEGDDLNGPYVNFLAISKQLKVEGFHVSRWVSRWDEGIKEVTGWIQEGKLSPKEYVTNGFENMRAALVGLLAGFDLAEAIVKV